MVSLVWKSLLLCFLLTFCAVFLRAQSFDYSFKHLTTDNGLSHDLTHSIVKDKQGFMWFGTLNGLNRFDGFEFKVFRHKRDDSASLLHNTVIDLVCDTAGYVWMSTPIGICRYDPFRQHFRSIQMPGLGTAGNWHLNIDSRGLIIVTHANSLYTIDPANLRVSLRKNFPRSFENVKIFRGKGQSLWLISKSALYRYDPQTANESWVMGYDDDHRREKVAVMYVYLDPKNRTWIGTYDKGLYYFDDTLQRCVLLTNDAKFIVSISADVNFAQNNLLWLGAGYSGLNVLDTRSLHVYDMPRNLQQSWTHNGGKIHSFYRDTTNGVLWLGTDFGLQKYDPGTVRFARKMLPTTGIVQQFPSVNTVLQDNTDPSGKTWWVCTWVGGLFKWNRQTDEFTSYSHKLETIELFDIEQDNDGNIWIAELRGIQIFHPVKGQWKVVDSFIRNDSVSSKVLMLHKDSLGNIWFSQNYDGLFRYDHSTKAIRRINLASALNRPERIWVTGIATDQSGQAWISSANHSFHVDANGKSTEIGLSSKSAFNIENSGAQGIAVDKDGFLWLTNKGNLVKLSKDGKVVRVYTEEDGIISNWLQTIVIDRQGILWITSDNALHRFDPATGLFRHYKKEDGLFDNNLSNQIHLADNGELFLGFNSAFSYTNTRRIDDRSIAVPFMFTYLQVEDKVISPIGTRAVTLQPHENTFVVEYAALDYSRPDRIRYAYRIEQNGSDTQWTYTSQRQLTFTNLAPGKYQLHLKVRDQEGVLSREELTLAIKVMPRFYETWWFWALLMLVCAGILYLFYTIRKEQHQRVEKMRDRIATDLHDDMGSTLSSIRIFSDVLKKQVGENQPQSAALLDKISNNAAQLSENMQDIIWTIKQDNDKLEDLVTRIREFGLKLCDARDIGFKVHISDSFITSRLNPEQRRNLYLIFKESLNNAIKYSGCDIIHLFITQQGRHLKMVIQDNGTGFDHQTVRKGNGLSNIQKRAREIGGAATIESSNGNGTRVDVLITL